MPYINYEKLWRNEFLKKVSAKARVQNIILYQSKFKVNDTCWKNIKKQQILKTLMLKMS